MSGKRSGRNDRGGWEEAAEEFYQEDFSVGPKTSQSIRGDTNERMLPSHFATVGRKTGRASMYQKQVNFTTAGTNEIIMPDLADASHDEIRSWEEIREIRNLPISMGEKLELKSKLMHTPTFRVRGVAAFRLKRKKWLYRIQNASNDFLSNFIPWNGQLKSIEGKYGSAHMAFFMFVRWLFFLNLVMSMIIGLLIVLPSELSHLSDECKGTLAIIDSSDIMVFPGSVSRNSYAVTYKSSEIAACGSTNITLSSLFTTRKCWKAYEYSVSNRTDNALSSVQDFIQGTGWMEITLAFYGYYKPLVFFFSETLSYYHLPVAYILVMLFLAVLSFVTVLNSIRRGLDLKAYSDNRKFRYMALTFATWNQFVADKQTGKFKVRIMNQEYKAMLLKDKIRREEISRTTKQNVILFFVRSVCWLCTLALWTLSGYIIYLTVDFSQSFLNEKGVTVVEFDLAKSEILLVSYLPSIVITALNFVTPFLFNQLITFEKYPAEAEINVALARRVMLRLSSLLILVVTIFSTGYESAVSCEITNPSSNSTICWETVLGQEMYKLALFDFATVVVKTFLFEFLFSRIALRTKSDSKCGAIFSPRTFSVVDNSLDLIYNQSVCWIGLYFCPIIVWVVTIKSFLAFYFNLFRCKINCVQSEHFVSVVKSSSLFLNVLLLVNMVCILVVGYSISYVPTSVSCGPFRGLGYAWESVVLEIRKLPTAAQDFVFFLGTPNFYIILLVLSAIILLYLVARITSQTLVISSLEIQLNWVSKDKQFLLQKMEMKENEQKENEQFQEEKVSHPRHRRGFTTQ